MLLQDLGREVRIAHDATQGIEIANAFVPEFALLDLGLPDISGFELARELRANPRTAQTVLIAVSGWGQARDRDRSRQTGFALHLVKPINVGGIAAALSALAEQR